MQAKLNTENNKPPLPVRLLLVMLLSVLAVGLASAVLSLPAQAPGLSAEVAVNIEKSGVTNPVTAVLLNYRAYDTLLELGVLLLALLGVWSLGGVSPRLESPPGPVLDILSRVLIPFLILVSGYLLWVGAYEPGGAFQAGAVLGAIGVLLLLSGWRPDALLDRRFAGFGLRLTLVAGLLVFIVVGLAFMLFARPFLEYPPELAAGLILLIETAATLSIGISLAALFLGGEPEMEKHQ